MMPGGKAMLFENLPCRWCFHSKRVVLPQVVFFLKQMSPEEVDEKYANVMRQRHMFVYSTE